MRAKTTAGVAFVLAALTQARLAFSYDIDEIGPAGGRFVLTDNSGSGAGGLSGITRDPATGKFYAVNDSDSRIYPVNLNINLATGEISLGSIDAAALQLNTAGGTPYAAGTRDQEGIAFDPSSNSVWVSNEGNPNDPQSSYTPTLTRHALSNGNLDATTTLPANFFQATNGVRVNRSLEALSRQLNGDTLWTANEGALNNDGPAPGVGVGTKVRLTRFDDTVTLDGQWVYETDASSSGFVSLISTLPDLLVLPDGTLIAMERSASIQNLNSSDEQYRIRLYEVDFAGATEVSSVATLAGSETNVAKTLLWEKIFTDDADNFEGITLGPALTDGSGDYSLILVADNDAGTPNQHSFYALRLSGIPEPGVLGMLTLAPALLTRSRRSK